MLTGLYLGCKNIAINLWKTDFPSFLRQAKDERKNTLLNNRLRMKQIFVYFVDKPLEDKDNA